MQQQQEDPKEVAKRQRERAEKIQAQLDEETERHQNAHIDSMLTTDAHVGKASGEPHKDQAEEDRKVNKASITGDPHVKTVPLKTEGETTDEVVTEPEGAQPGGGAAPPPDMVERAAGAAAESRNRGGSKSKKKGR